jgi:hypothetical protein
MKNDWSTKALCTGLVLSLTAFVIHSSGAASLDALNPLLATGCATTVKFQPAMAPPTGVSSRTVKLKRGKSFYEVPGGQNVSVTTVNGPLEPLRLYGVDYERKILYASNPDGVTMGFPIGDITHMRLIKENKVGLGAGMGAIGGLIAGALIGGSAGGDLGAVCGSVVGTGGGALIGAVGGAIGSIDEQILTPDDAWKIYIPEPTEAPPAAKKEPASPELEMAPPETKTEAPAQPNVETPAPAEEKEPAPKSGSPEEGGE